MVREGQRMHMPREARLGRERSRPKAEQEKGGNPLHWQSPNGRHCLITLAGMLPERRMS